MFSMSKTWSIVARSGERLGQGNALTLLACKKFMERRAVGDQAVSLCMNGITTGHKCHPSSAVHSVFVLSQPSWSFLRNALLPTTVTNCH
jgi:hypothetical protein